MKLLILGGTVFLGRHLVETALAGGHEVTLFNRGRHNPQLFPEVEKLRGNRDGDVAALLGRTFDAVVDTSGYTAEQASTSAEALRDHIGHYTFVSSVSVYRSFAPGRAYDEGAPVEAGHEGYGALKARSEEVLHDQFPNRLACVRPGLIVGPHDPTERFTYWVRRIARGGRVLAPGRPERPVQFIDARDLARWCVHLAEQRAVGVFNATGPASTLTMAELLEACQAVTTSDAGVHWMPDDELLAAGVSPWTELPLWIPESDPMYGGMLLADTRRAVAAGLSCRPVADTVSATFEWDRGRGDTPASPMAVTPMTPEREAALLDARVA